jgi:7-carboxy-7-deazaguanine synthase
LADEANIVVITGGEPTVYDLNPLVAALHLANLQVHLETSGGFPITGLMDWITLSPKRWKPPKVDSVMLADEFKIIVEHPDDIHYYHGLLLETGLPTIAKNPIWLHPEWSHRDDPKVLEAIVRAVKAGPTFRAGWQLHKLYKVDQQDKRSQVQVPLGGDLAKGL